MAHRPDLRIETSIHGSTRTIAVSGSLDAGSAGSLMDAFQFVGAAGLVSTLVLDLRGLSVLDGAGLWALTTVDRRAREHDLALLLRPPAIALAELLREVGLAGRFTLGPQTEGCIDGSCLERLEVRLACDPHAPARARHEVRGVIGHLGWEAIEVLVLLTSELVSNAVLHSSGQAGIELRVVTAPACVRIEVGDAGAGFDPRRPRQRQPDAGGRGLLLVDQLASRWGGETTGPDGAPGFCVWFELDTAPVAVA